MKGETDSMTNVEIKEFKSFVIQTLVSKYKMSETEAYLWISKQQSWLFV